MDIAGADFQLDTSRAIVQASAHIQATQKQLNLAAQRAMRKTQRYINMLCARQLSTALGISQGRLKRRLRSSHTGKGLESVFSVWFGAFPMAAEEAGNARQTRKGVTVGKHRFDGAFYRPVFSANPRVWIRSGRNIREQHPVLGKPRRGLSARPGRFPIERVAVEVSEPAARIFAELEAKAERRFFELMLQELNYVVNVEKK